MLIWMTTRPTIQTSRFFCFPLFPIRITPSHRPGKYWDLYDPADMKLPASFPKNGVPDMPFAAWLHEHRGPNSPSRGGPAAGVVNEREAREMIALTYGMIAMVDDAIGRIVAQVQELGLTEDTVVIFTSDHGDFQAAHGLMLKGPIHIDNLIRD